ncbi:MAG TPA: amphi-Trp domain-containing protein [Anaerolineae bacterium]|nr:amphi-Trp domain-containing protein [Anaerolineae bacterium]
MRRYIQIIGLLLAAEGLITIIFSKNYLKIWRTDKLGPGYLRLIESLIALPDKTIRLSGLSLMITGASVALLASGEGEEEKIEIEETVPRERFIQLLRGLAESVERSTEFQTIIKGQQISIPPQGEMKVEFETEDQGRELELELEWQPTAQAR